MDFSLFLTKQMNLYFVKRWCVGHEECSSRRGSFNARQLSLSFTSYIALTVVETFPGNVTSNTGLQSARCEFISSFLVVSKFSFLPWEFGGLIHGPAHMCLHSTSPPAAVVGTSSPSVLCSISHPMGYFWLPRAFWIVLAVHVQALQLSSHKTK